MLEGAVIRHVKPTAVQRVAWLEGCTKEGTADRQRQRLESVARTYRALQRLTAERAQPSLYY